MDEPTGFSSHTGISWNGTTGVVEYGGGDKGMVVIFYKKPLHDPSKSAETGRPFFVDKIFVRIAPPGERLNIVDREAHDGDRRRWPMQWAQFQQNKEQHPDGTPIDMLFPEQPSVGATLRASGVQTIEQCAELSGNAIDNIGMGAQSYCNAAKKYLEQANKGVGIAQHRRDMEERDRQIKVLTRQIEELQSALKHQEHVAINTPSLAQIQAMFSQMQGRPTHMPNVSFDPQTAMINNTSTTAQVTQARTPRRRAKISM